jgi:hypothetical protein
MRRAPGLLAASLLLLLLLGGCAGQLQRGYATGEGTGRYASVATRYTRTKEVRDGVDTRFILTATWISDPWLGAFAEEYGSIYYLDPAKRDARVGEWKGESQKYLRFFVAVFTPDEKTNDLDRPGTLWSLRVVRADEKDFAPVYVRPTTLRPEEVDRLFPVSSDWYRCYEVAFPLQASEKVSSPPPDAPMLRLVLSGVQGRAVLSW